MSSTMRHKGISVLPILVAILVLLALLLPLQAQLQGTSVQQGLRTIQAQAALTADAGGQWLAVQISAESKCPDNLNFTDPKAPELSVTLGCQVREYDQAKQFDLEVEVQYQQPSHPDYIRQHYQWVLAL